jgi:hypothetical protein
MKYLVFTQQEKKDLMRMCFEVNTIHEVQGMTFKRVILVRLYAKQMTIYDSMQHILVALSRHTEWFEYATVRFMDTIHNLIATIPKDENVTNLVKAEQRALVFSASMGSVAKTHKEINVVNPERPKTYYVKYEPRKYIKRCNSPVGEVLVDLLSEQMINGDGIKLPVDNFTVVNANEINVPKRQFVCNDFYGDPALVLQRYYDTLFPDSGFLDKNFDEYQIETSDLTLYLSNVRIDTNKLAEGTAEAMPLYTLEPRLRTNQPNIRPRTARQTLLALGKRNCDTPKNALPINTALFLDETIEAFFKHFCVEDVKKITNEYVLQPVEFNLLNLRSWVDGLETQKIKRFNFLDIQVGLKEVLSYQMMIKPEPKNKMEANAHAEYLPVQNIIHHSDAVNAVFGSMFKQLFERFVSVLRPEILCMLKKNIDDMQDHFNQYLLTRPTFLRQILRVELMTLY